MIHLINDYYLSADKYGYTVGVPKKNKDGQMWMSSPRYYNALDKSVSSTAEQVLRDKIISGDITSLNGAVAELQNIKNELGRIVISVNINKE